MSKAKDIYIYQVEDANEKMKIVEEVLLDLPDWFGIESSTKAYIEASRDLTVFAAKFESDILGFLTVKETSADAVELYCMGVKEKMHKQGIGSMLFRAYEANAIGQYKFMHVKTVDEGLYPEYDGTIRFYERMGFTRLEVIPNLWGEENPCLILVKGVPSS